ncbi:MAG: transglycosylase domain-containing protein, partial [Gemmatimonadaceae bacterium]|nr:transglycosylase domain-containing protein [Gemmatimonadaceae bacterium]
MPASRPSLLARLARLRIVRALACLVLGVGAFGTGGLVAGWLLVCANGQCPNAAALDGYTPRQTSRLYAIDGRFLAELGLERRTVTRLADIPPIVRQAFITTEDKRFYDHPGIDFVRIFGSVAANVVRGGFAQGFSTITMQLARNIFPERLTREKSIVRKLREAKVALEIERRYSKDQILELYLNQIYFGNGAFGVESASERYFGKSVRDLVLPEAALLAALPKAPERYNPRRNPDRAIQRRNVVVELLRRDGKVTDAEASLARAYPLQLAQRGDAGDVGPYFVEWV